ncbi:MAG: SpoIID/LytB domain-containing protein, partial [Anaerolineae bacterium]|nr:SpoIID/LytB domain-containing protein [Anaerolineae bacterium]
MGRGKALGVGIAGVVVALAFVLTTSYSGAAPTFEPASTSTALSQAELVGQVMDALTGAPVADAQVGVGDARAQTDAGGRYRLVVPPGRVAVRVEAPGYIGLTYPDEIVQPAAPTSLSVALIAARLTPAERGQLARSLPRWADEGPQTADGGPQTEDRRPRMGEGQGKTASPGVVLDAVATAPATVRVLMPNGQIVELDTDDYLKGVVPFEMGAGSPLEAQKAQAVAARTYAATHCLADSAGDPTRCEPGVDANVDTTTRTQVWRPSPRYDTSNRAVDATHGVVLREGVRLASATLYFARTYFATRNNEDVFQGPPYAYLRSVASPDPFNKRYGHGVGMSQEGAMVLADWGAKYDDILRHYYTGLSVDYAPAPTATSTATPTPGAAAAKGSPNVLSGQWSIHGADWSAGTAEEAAVGGGQLKAATLGQPGRYTSRPFQADFEFQALAVEWAPAAPQGSQVLVEVRLSKDGQTWGEWTPMEALDGGPRDDSDRSTGLHFGLARYAQVRLTLDQGQAAAPLALDRLTVLYYDGRQGPTSAELAAQYKADAPLAPGVAKPNIVPRSVWGAPETYQHWNLCYTDRGFPVDGYIKPNAWAVHHSADDHTDIDGAAWLRIVYQFHSVGRGWGDIGYHYVVDRNGVIYQGRTPGNPPAGYIAEGGHALQYNCGSGSVMALGNYQPGINVPLVPLTQATQDGLVRILAWL